MSERLLFPLDNNKGVQSRIANSCADAPHFGLYDVAKQSFVVVTSAARQDIVGIAVLEQLVRVLVPSTMVVLHAKEDVSSLCKEKDVALMTTTFATVQEVIDNYK
jgi:predicted Fe-Mo cluster-binding NifX family protein